MSHDISGANTFILCRTNTILSSSPESRFNLAGGVVSLWIIWSSCPTMNNALVLDAMHVLRLCDKAHQLNAQVVFVMPMIPPPLFPCAI